MHIIVLMQLTLAFQEALRGLIPSHLSVGAETLCPLL
jgi:hypothetical protein